MQSIAVREGARVNPGDTLVQLSNALVERDAASTRAQLALLDARARRAGRPRVVAGAPRDTLEITAKILDLKRQRFNKMRELRKTNDVTSRELEQAEIEYLAALREYNRERQVVMGAAITIADPELLAIERQKIAADQRFAAERHAMLRLASPIAGVVTRIHVTPGQSVFPRDTVAEVSDVSTVHVRGSVAPELLRFIRPGLRVEVRILSVPPRSFADEVEYVIPAPANARPQERMATVVVAIPNPDGVLQANTEAVITVRTP